MITYEVTSVVEPELAERYERYMRERHIPELLATGCFVAASFSRSEPGRYRARYEAPDRAALDRYLAEHAAALRGDVERELPGAVRATREEWSVLERWEAGG